ncbi:hypothetical protein KC349_g254 [Hortaea werneckii]|nr:hypothetical protein KC349_g254 [Hortaea werneckii]
MRLARGREQLLESFGQICILFHSSPQSPKYNSDLNFCPQTVKAFNEAQIEMVIMRISPQHPFQRVQSRQFLTAVRIHRDQAQIQAKCSILCGSFWRWCFSTQVEQSLSQGEQFKMPVESRRQRSMELISTVNVCSTRKTWGQNKYLNDPESLPRCPVQSRERFFDLFVKYTVHDFDLAASFCHTRLVDAERVNVDPLADAGPSSTREQDTPVRHGRAGTRAWKCQEVGMLLFRQSSLWRLVFRIRASDLNIF